MRRSVIVLALIAACALVAAPASAQVQSENNWFVNASVGPSFGTLGSTPGINASAGYKLTPYVSLGGEFGVLPHAPFDKANVVAPAPGSITSPAAVHVNAYHTNANLFVQSAPLGRFEPYATIGIGAFTGSTVAKTDLPDSTLKQYSRETNWAENFGVGTGFRLTNWLGLNADYRHFIVNATDTQHVNRFTTGVSLFVK
jgi:opacity protein-like surface antigen